MRYIVVASANGRSFYLAKQRIGSEDYITIATFTDEVNAKKTAAAMNEKSSEAQDPQGRRRVGKRK
jgi:hypothetical protein